MLGVGLHHDVPFDKSITVSSLSSLHSGRTTRNLLKDSRVPRLVFDLIALENDSAFELSKLIGFR